jgi:hypothetical protein
VITGERWKTQAAYDRLAKEEKQTKAAYEKLSIEEKRTKAAYAKLAEEQSRTKAAYSAEEFQRQLAEWDFAQAQRAIELVVQFSEGELAHSYGHQDIRRRLLLTVLDYYEEFLTQHAGEPVVQAGRARVALLVTELSKLGGKALMTIIHDGNVEKELKLLEEQKKGFAAILNSQTEQPIPADKGKDKDKSHQPRFLDTAEVEKALTDILKPAQRVRFQQIVLQVQNQGRYGFSDPDLVKALGLTTPQRASIRQIQNETHKLWADHLFTAKKVPNSTAFWADAQHRILMVLNADQQRQWLEMVGPPVAVDFREGYPFDGKNVDLPATTSPPFELNNTWRGSIVVMQSGSDHAGSGFGHKAWVDDKQYYSWRGKEIPPTVFEIAVTAGPLTLEERQHLLTNGDESPPDTNGPSDWLVVFRSADPSVWNTHSPLKSIFAIPLSQAPIDVRYLRLKRMDTGEIQIVAVRHADLARYPGLQTDQDFIWNGCNTDAYGGRHLGIGQTRPLPGSTPGPPKMNPEGKRLLPP